MLGAGITEQPVAIGGVAEMPKRLGREALGDSACGVNLGPEARCTSRRYVRGWVAGGRTRSIMVASNEASNVE